MFFLPQRSYVFPGSLHAQITYPRAPARPGDANYDAESHAVMEALRLAEVDELADEDAGIAFEADWTVMLSSSERQRLSFARLFFHRPLFCLADESTSAMDLASEARLLQRTRDLHITLVSVAHRPSVTPHHDKILYFDAAVKQWRTAPVTAEHLADKFVPVNAQDDQNSAARRRSSHARSMEVHEDELIVAQKESDAIAAEQSRWYLDTSAVARLLMFLSGAVPSLFSKGAAVILLILFCMVINATIQVISAPFISRFRANFMRRRTLFER